MKMKKPLLALAVASLLPVAAHAVRPSSSVVPLNVADYGIVADQQDTNAYFGNPNVCPATVTGTYEVISNLRPGPNVPAGPTTAWDSTFLGAWTTVTDLTSGSYRNGDFCSATGSCLRAEFSTSDKVFSLDTRSTSPAQTLTVDFSAPWNPSTGTPGTNKAPWATFTSVGLLQVSATDAITGMGVCSSKACPEARQINTKYWFNDAQGNQWRIDWGAIRVLRVKSNVWYFIADACGGSQLAGLSELVGTRTKPREVLNGYFLIPMFFSATLQ